MPKPSLMFKNNYTIIVITKTKWHYSNVEGERVTPWKKMGNDVPQTFQTTKLVLSQTICFSAAACGNNMFLTKWNDIVIQGKDFLAEGFVSSDAAPS